MFIVQDEVIKASCGAYLETSFGTGPENITKAQCSALHCCYNPTTINVSSSLQGPNCFYPINAEISAYATSYLTATHIDAVGEFQL